MLLLCAAPRRVCHGDILAVEDDVQVLQRWVQRWQLVAVPCGVALLLPVISAVVIRCFAAQSDGQHP
eukprot:2639592-Karenia_brevis.AAC.1